MCPLNRSLFWSLFLVGALVGNANCSGDLDVDGRPQALLTDGGADAGGDGGAPAPRIQQRVLSYNGVSTGASLGLYDNSLGTPCHPEITGDGKLRCMPDGDELDGLQPAFPAYLDATCTQMVVVQYKPGCEYSALTGRHLFVRAKLPASACNPKSNRIQHVYKVTLAMTSSPATLYQNYSYGCTAWAKDLPSDALTRLDLIQTESIALSEFAELTTQP
jgi:hypothetical protein